MTHRLSEPLESLYGALLARDATALSASLHADADRAEVLTEFDQSPWLESTGDTSVIDWISIRNLPGDIVVAHGRVVMTDEQQSVKQQVNKPDRQSSGEFAHMLRLEQGAVRSLVRILPLRCGLSTAESAPVCDHFETIEYTVSDGLAEIRLNRPGARNAIDFTVSREFLAAVLRCAADPDVRAVLLSGAGNHLTVGGDISYFNESHDYPFGELLARMTAPFHEGFRILSEMEVPVVTAAQGSVAGGGLGFAYAADIVLASPDAVFITAFSRLGVSGDGGGTWYLPRLVGHRRAAQMYLQNLLVTAEQAVDWGLATDIVDGAHLRDHARGLALELAAGPTRAYGAMRSMLRRSWSNDLSTQLLEESMRIAETGSSRDAAEGVAAFAEKRTAVFTGE